MATGKNKRPRQAEISESTRYRGSTTEREGAKEKGVGGRRWRAEKPREKLIYVSCAYCRMHIYRRAHFRASDPRIEKKDDYLHRDTSSLNRLFYLLIYLPVMRAACVPCSSTAMSFPFLFAFSYFAREHFCGREGRLLIRIESLNIKCDGSKLSRYRNRIRPK